MTYPKISIVVPVYNAERYLAECLDSALSQTYPCIEVVCVNDGSTDTSQDILSKYEKSDDRIRVITQKNSGVIIARNKAIDLASGEYILPLDSDDYIAQDCLKNLYNALFSLRCEVAAPSVEYIGANQGACILPEPTAMNMAHGNCIVNCALFAKKYWVKYGGYDERFANGLEDYDFWWNFIQARKKIVRVSDALFFYRIKEKGESRNLSTEDYHDKSVELIKNKYPRMQKLQYKRIKMQKRQQKKMRLQLLIKRAKNVFEWRDYKNYVLNNQLDKSDFVSVAEHEYLGNKPKKLISFYLPQYYQIPQNDLWYGRGFTEWTNCTKAVPQYTGHWQPHLPIDVGFYDLETTRVMYRQIELAKLYGLFGFCYYFYWFTGGERIMEKPLDNLLKDKSLDFPFMLFWANEDWTNNWGDQSEIGEKVYSAKMQSGDAELFVDDLLPFLRDDRYITIEGRPHLIIYQAKKDPNLKSFIADVRRLIKENDVNDPYISLVFPDESPETFCPYDYGADAAVEFGVHMKVRPDYIQQPINRNLINPAGIMSAYDMTDFVKNRQFDYYTDFPVFKGAMTTYDNTARKIYTGAHMFSLSPELYEEWLSELVKTSGAEYIFITAWNEWAEGMHLEPDQRFGYAYLQATRNALEKINSLSEIELTEEDSRPG